MQSIKILNGYLPAQMDIHQGNTYRKNFGWQHFGCYHPKYLLSSDMRVFRVFLSLFSAHNYHAEIVSYCLSESSKSQNFMGRRSWIPLRGLRVFPNPQAGFFAHFTRSVHHLDALSLSFLFFFVFSYHSHACFLSLLLCSIYFLWQPFLAYSQSFPSYRLYPTVQSF